MTNQIPSTSKSAVAYGKFIRGSASKVRRVLDQIRGRTYRDALIMLEFMPYRSTGPITKVLRSAVANAEHNLNMDPSNLVITKEEGSRPRLCSALATADRNTLVIGSVDRYGMNSSMINASL